MKELSESKKNDDIKEEESQKLKSEAKSENLESPIISSINTNNNIFGKEQQMCICPFCKMRMFTDIDQEVSWIGIVLSILILIFFKLY